MEQGVRNFFSFFAYLIGEILFFGLSGGFEMIQKNTHIFHFPSVSDVISISPTFWDSDAPALTSAQWVTIISPFGILLAGFLAFWFIIKNPNDRKTLVTWGMLLVTFISTGIIYMTVISTNEQSWAINLFFSYSCTFVFIGLAYAMTKSLLRKTSPKNLILVYEIMLAALIAISFVIPALSTV